MIASSRGSGTQHHCSRRARLGDATYASRRILCIVFSRSLLPKREEIFGRPDMRHSKTFASLILERQLGQLRCHFFLLGSSKIWQKQPLQALMMR